MEPSENNGKVNERSIRQRFKSKIAIGMGILISVGLLCYVYVWIYDAFLSIFVKQSLDMLAPYISVTDGLSRVVIYGLSLVAFTWMLLVLSFCIGSLVETFVGRAFKRTLGRLVEKVPGYTMMSKVVKNLIHGGGMKQFRRFGLAYIDGAPGDDAVCMPVIITGESATHYSVMTPSAPTPMSGFMYFYPKHRVIELDVQPNEFFSYVVSMGVGSLEMHKKTLLR